MPIMTATQSRRKYTSTPQHHKGAVMVAKKKKATESVPGGRTAAGSGMRTRKDLQRAKIKSKDASDVDADTSGDGSCSGCRGL